MNLRSATDLILDYQMARKRCLDLAEAKADADRASDALVALLESHGVREVYHSGQIYSIEWRGPGQAEIVTRPIKWLTDLTDSEADPDSDSFVSDLISTWEPTNGHA